MRLDAHAPHGDVHLVDAAVAGIAGAEVVPPVPSVVVAVRLERAHRSGADPQVVVESGRRIARLFVADVGPLLAGPGLGDQDLADRSFAQQLDGVLKRGRAAASACRPASRDSPCARPRSSAGLRGCCASRASRRTRACRPGRPGSPPGRANGRARPRPPRRPTCRRESSADRPPRGRPWLPTSGLGQPLLVRVAHVGDPHVVLGEVLGQPEPAPQPITPRLICRLASAATSDGTPQLMATAPAAVAPACFKTLRRETRSIRGPHIFYAEQDGSVATDSPSTRVAGTISSLSACGPG